MDRSLNRYSQAHLYPPPIEISADYRDDEIPEIPQDTGNAFRGLVFGFAFTLAGVGFVYFIVSVVRAIR